MAEYNLIKIEEFVVKPNVTGNEWIPAGLGGTYRIKASAIRDYSISSKNLLSRNDVINNLTSTSFNQPVSALQAKILKDLIDGFAAQIGSGIIGEAVPSTIPITEGFGIYLVSTAGTYTNFLDSDSNPIVVTSADLQNGIVQLWGNNNVWEKHIIEFQMYAPVFSNNLSN